jgi:large subunit ribosomal protein L10
MLEQAKNVVVMKMFAIPVNEINKVRMAVAEDGGKLQVVKKRLFVRALEETGYEGVDLNNLEGSVIVLYSLEDEFKPLKSINKFRKQWKKDKQKYSIEYLGGFYDKQWKDSAYVTDVAELPTKEELIGKFAFLIKYPVQAFAMNLKQIAEKKEQEESAQ